MEAGGREKGGESRRHDVLLLEDYNRLWYSSKVESDAEMILESRDMNVR